MSEEDKGLTSRVGPIEVDWPRTIGYYGGIGLALAFELIEPPLAIFIGAIPFFKMLNYPNAQRPVRFLSQLLDGAAKPVGGDAEATLRLPKDEQAPQRKLSLIEEARALLKQREAQAPS